MADGTPWYMRLVLGVAVLLSLAAAGMAAIIFVGLTIEFGLVVPLAVGGFLALALVAGTVFGRVTS